MGNLAINYTDASVMHAAHAAAHNGTNLALNNMGIYDALDYGAVADGTTDCTSSIQSAINAASNAGGGVVLLPAGIYYLGAGAIVPAAGVWIMGAGRFATILKGSTTATGGTGDGIRWVNTNTPYPRGVVISNLAIDCSGQYTGYANGATTTPYSNGITIQGIDDVRIENVRIIKPYGYGVMIGTAGGGTPYINRPVIRGLYIEGERGGYDSLGGGGIQYAEVDGLFVYPASDGTDPYGSLTNWTNMQDCFFRHLVGVSVSQHNAGAVQTDFGAVGIIWEDVFISGFKFAAVFSSVAGQIQPTRLRASRWVVETVTTNAFLINSAAALGPVGLTIEDCDIQAWDTSAIAAPAIQYKGVSHGQVLNNRFGPTATAYCITLTTDGTNSTSTTLVEGNDTTQASFTVNLASIGAGVVVRNNPGYNPVGLVSVSVPSSTVAVAAVGYDRTFHITAGASTVACAVTNAAGTGQTVATIPSLGYGPVLVPAGSTLTPTYASAPTWTVQGN